MVDTLEATLRLALRVKVELLSLFQKTKPKSKRLLFRDSRVFSSVSASTKEANAAHNRIQQDVTFNRFGSFQSC